MTANRNRVQRSLTVIRHTKNIIEFKSSDLTAPVEVLDSKELEQSSARLTEAIKAAILLKSIWSKQLEDFDVNGL
jgi:hypothetical protein